MHEHLEHYTLNGCVHWWILAAPVASEETNATLLNADGPVPTWSTLQSTAPSAKSRNTTCPRVWLVLSPSVKWRHLRDRTVFSMQPATSRESSSYSAGKHGCGVGTTIYVCDAIWIFISFTRSTFYYFISLSSFHFYYILVVQFSLNLIIIRHKSFILSGTVSY